jgi:hypothetical protein
MKLAPIADRVAAEVYVAEIDPWHAQESVIRDRADFASDCELSTWQLDLLCDMIRKRLRNMPVRLLGRKVTAADVRAAMLTIKRERERERRA